MRKVSFVTKVLLLLSLSLFTVIARAEEKEVYISRQMKSEGYSETDNSTMWSRLRSRESDNFIVFWQQGFGDDPGTKTWSEGVKAVDIDYLLEQLERFYAYYADTLKFIDTTDKTTYSSKYKMIANLYFTTDWMAYGSGTDSRIGNMWISPSTCQPVGATIAHECGHCFQAQAGYDTGAPAGFNYEIGSGCTLWEQTAEWQSFQFYPSERFKAHMPFFQDRANMAFTHEYMRYQSVWLFHYWTEKHGKDFVGRMWRSGKVKGQDIHEVYMENAGMSVDDYYIEMYDAYSRAATFDLETVSKYRGSWINKYSYNCVDLRNGFYQVTYKSCPQVTGFNVIPLDVPAAGTELTMSFMPLSPASPLIAGDPGICNDYSDIPAERKKKVSSYNTFSNGTTSHVGFCIGYVALLKDGTRIYSDMTRLKEGDDIVGKAHEVKFTVPDNTLRLYFVVTPAPHYNGQGVYYRHLWDEDDSVGDDQWPYRFKIEGTTLASTAKVYTNPRPAETIDALYINGKKITGFRSDVKEYEYKVNPGTQVDEISISATLPDSLDGYVVINMPTTLPGKAEVIAYSDIDALDATYTIEFVESIIYDWDGAWVTGEGSEPTNFGWMCEESIRTDTVNGADSTFHYIDSNEYTGYTYLSNDYNVYRLLSMPFFNNEVYKFNINGMSPGRTYLFKCLVTQTDKNKDGKYSLTLSVKTADGEVLASNQKSIYYSLAYKLSISQLKINIAEDVSADNITVEFALEQDGNKTILVVGDLELIDRGAYASIDELQMDENNSQQKAYDLTGREITVSNYKGVCIVGGKKILKY